jgi:ribosome modulation factor
MYMAGFEKTACRVQTDRDRSIWMKGFDSAREKWLTMTQRWHEMDKGAR